MIEINPQQLKAAHYRLVRRMVLIALGMFALGFAIAPYYDQMCRYLGVTPKVKAESFDGGDFNVVSSREINFEFITSVSGGMPLEFRVEKPNLRIHPGEYYKVRFFAKNLSNGTLIGQAIPSVAPIWTANHLKKTECFCFAQQVFEPNVEREMPVRFVVDPDVPMDVKDMTLSYTFFDITDKKPR